LAPSAFWRFGQTTPPLAHYAFNDINKLLEAAIDFLNEIRPSELQFVFITGSNE
jgi:hypothetical protein